jgi:methyltransferase-like protein/cyclopropane fatty-acyl-phospholipid synthase-like methyltransferase
MSSYIYDIVEYDSHPYCQTYPENLYTIARLFNLNPTNFEEARVLELGCGGGWNIIPMAYSLPETEFTGIDLSKNQIEKAQKYVNDIGLENISFEHKSILDIDNTIGHFDYIICHGVYSWVPKNVQEKIFAILRDNLTDNGIGHISYNTLPGWNIVKSFRDMMLYHIALFDSHEEKAEQARSLLNFVTETLKEDTSSYSELLRNEVEMLSSRSDSYLIHDHLGEVNDPVYFYQFIETAHKFDLCYLADIPVSSMFIENLPESVSPVLSQIDDIVRANQYMDFIRNQRFRNTLLCLDKNSPINRNIKKNDIKKFHLTFSSDYDSPIPEHVLKNDVNITFKNDMLSYTPEDNISKIALITLIRQNGKPVSFDNLCELVMEQTEIRDKNKISVHIVENTNLMRLMFGGLVTIYSSGGNYTSNIKEKPIVSFIARYQAENQIYVTNLRHEIVTLNLFERIIIQYLDGKHTYEDIKKNIIEHIEKGDFQVLDDQNTALKDIDQIEKKCENLCRESINRFSKEALLINSKMKLYYHAST